MDGHHEALLVEAGKRIREALTSTGVTGHPVLAAHPSHQQQALALAQHERYCSANQLRQALERALDWTEWQMFICRYGLKTSAEEFFPLLLAAHGANEQQLGPLRARTAWAQALADFGTQTTLNGNPAVVYPSPSLKYSRQFKWLSRWTYPLFGMLGRGFGGMEVQGADGSNVVKAAKEAADTEDIFPLVGSAREEKAGLHDRQGVQAQGLGTEGSQLGNPFAAQLGLRQVCLVNRARECHG